MATLPKVLINRADCQIGGGVALRLRTQAVMMTAISPRGAWWIFLANAPLGFGQVLGDLASTRH
jgi:hypothetical protein